MNKLLLFEYVISSGKIRCEQTSSISILNCSYPYMSCARFAWSRRSSSQSPTSSSQGWRFSKYGNMIAIPLANQKEERWRNRSWLLVVTRCSRNEAGDIVGFHTSFFLFSFQLLLYCRYKTSKTERDGNGNNDRDSYGCTDDDADDDEEGGKTTDSSYWWTQRWPWIV